MIPNLFSAPSPVEIATKELTQTERELLAMQSLKEYATHMVECLSQRVERLSLFVRESSK